MQGDGSGQGSSVRSWLLGVSSDDTAFSGPDAGRGEDATSSLVDTSNSEFWNELCGSQLARTLGVTDSSIPSLKRFDDWYFDFYPYLLPFVSAAGLKGRRVLEVGLGYGSLSQKVAEFGATYTGLTSLRGRSEWSTIA